MNTLLPQPQPGDLAPSATTAWHSLLAALLSDGRAVAPRGQATVEVLHHVSLTVDLRRPVVTDPARRLNYRFMAAEALWIAAGRDDLAPLTAVNPKMADFSDDGRTLAGAYGPRIRPQVPYVVDCLVRDRDTRQAALTIWTPSPGPSKDVPCTIAMVFSIRERRLYQHVFMRSSDAWLGIPYDIFSFSLLAAEVACRYNIRPVVVRPIGLGHLTITCTSSHLYEQHFEAARSIVANALDRPPPEYNEDDILHGRFEAIRWRVKECANRAPGTEPRYPL